MNDKENMNLTIREGFPDVLHGLMQLRVNIKFMEKWAESFEYQQGKVVVKKVKLAQTQSAKSVNDEGCQTAPALEEWM